MNKILKLAIVLFLVCAVAAGAAAVELPSSPAPDPARVSALAALVSPERA